MDLQKRTVIAVVLSILIIIVYSSLSSKYYPIENKEVTDDLAGGVDSVPVTSVPKFKAYPKPESPAPQQIPALEYTPISLETEAVIFGFSPFGGNLVSIKFKQYDFDVPSNALVATQEWSDLEFSHRKRQDAIIFTYQDEQKEITKEYKFSEGGYYLEFYLTIRNLTPYNTDSYYTIFSEFSPSKSSIDERYKDTTIMIDEDNILRHNNLRIRKGTNKEFKQAFRWVGLRDKYFAYILHPTSSAFESIDIAKTTDGNDIIKVYRKNQAIQPGEEVKDGFLYYAGPQIDKLLVASGADFEKIRNFGKLDAIVKFLLRALLSIHNVVKSWGLSIIILTILIYICLYPLTIKQMRSMKTMQALQPEMEALKSQYKDNPQRLNKEIMELYKAHKANPLGGCFPVIFQIPVFFSLFQALSRAIELKGAGFLWIKDLSAPDRFIPGGLGGMDINLLPILMMVGMFFQQKMSMRNVSGTQSEQQKMMLWVMPIVFGFIFYNMPSGLVLYWFTNSLLMMASQWKALK
ncbi:MAG: membrane protein insertase YidC [Candidatus Omnitrophica bacterium]|nr:membrane protein insertase YidC [Candidatus Omnitrophota bacterium]